MIDKQKLLQWIEDQRYIYGSPQKEEDTPDEIASWSGRVKMVNKLEMDIRAGNLDVEEVAHERSEASII